MGLSEYAPAAEKFTVTEEGRMNGCLNAEAAGTYLHGFFDTAEITNALLTALWERKRIGKAPEETRDISAIHEAQYAELAGTLRNSLDMSLLYRLIR